MMTYMQLIVTTFIASGFDYERHGYSFLVQMIVFRQASRTFTNPAASSIELLVGMYVGYVYVQPVVV
jgi:hypothetical protein